MRKGHHDDNGIYNSTKRWKPLNEILQKLKCLYSHKGGQKKEFIYKKLCIFKRFHLLIFRERGREGERGEKHQCVRETSVGCLLQAPNLRSGLQPRHVPRLGIEPATLWFTGRLSTHWATSQGGKNMCLFLYVWISFNHLQRTLHLMQYTYQDVISSAQNNFWTHQFWCFLVLLPFFVSPFPHWQNSSLWGHFSSKKLQ